MRDTGSQTEAKSLNHCIALVSSQCMSVPLADRRRSSRSDDACLSNLWTREQLPQHEFLFNILFQKKQLWLISREQKKPRWLTINLSGFSMNTYFQLFRWCHRLSITSLGSPLFLLHLLFCFQTVRFVSDASLQVKVGSVRSVLD